MVTVYTKPTCGPCRATKGALKMKGIEFEEVDVTQNDEALAKIIEWGFVESPVVDSPIGRWSGFRMEKIKELAEYGT